MDSDDFRKLSAETQGSYEYLRQYVPVRGYNIGSLDGASLEEILEDFEDRPGLYRRLRSSLIRVSRFAAQPRNRWRSGAVLHTATLPPLKNIKRWHEDRVETALKSAEGDIRTMVALIYFTGQRLVDVVRLKPSNRRIVRSVEDGQPVVRHHFTITQSKTGQDVEPEITPELERYLPTVGDDRFYIGGSTTPASPKYMRDRWRDVRDSYGLAGTTPHGLRKDACCEAIEGGCSEAEAMGLMGHLDPKSTAIYFKEANRAKMAAGAFRARNTARGSK